MPGVGDTVFYKGERYTIAAVGPADLVIIEKNHLR